MLQAVKKWFHDIMTEPNNDTHCIVRWVAILATLQGLGMAAFTVIFRQADYDMVQFFTGMGIAVTTLGVALGMKKDSE